MWEDQIRLQGEKREKGARLGAFSKKLFAENDLFFERKRTEALVEASHTATFYNLTGATSPSWVRLRVNLKRHSVAFRAPSGAGLKSRPVCHYHFNSVVVGMNFLFHGHTSENEASV